MKKVFCLFIVLAILLGRNNANCQSLFVFNCDTTAFPTIKANFFALDAEGNQITNLSSSDFTITENGQQRTVINLSCPEQKQPEALSSVLVIDVSGSMQGMGMDIAKAAANAWIDMLPLGKSECAITSFNNGNFLNQDFTTNKVKLINGINSLTIGGGTNYNAAMIEPTAGGVLVAKTGKYKRVIVFLSDGAPNAGTKIADIINEALANNIIIYCVTIGMPASQYIKDFSAKTGGLYFENIKTQEEVEGCYRSILSLAQSSDPCQIEWQSEINCNLGSKYVKAAINSMDLKSNTIYQPPIISVANLEFSPKNLQLLNATPGIPKDTTILVTARNSDFNITNISSSNPAFTINPTSFFLKAGESRNLDIRFIPEDSCYVFTKFTIESDKCPSKYYVSGGFPGKLSKTMKIKLIEPNGGQEFIAGIDTVIKWEGVDADERITLEYSTNNGVDWELISNNAKGLSHNWRVPNTPSNKCLVKITSNGGLQTVNIGKQSWMRYNLNVDHYRNGDPIPEVTDSAEWVNTKAGAWCYYNNDPRMGEIYGKLYNWYALNDSRGLATRGWIIPSDKDWVELVNYLGGSKIAGGKLKTIGTIENGDGLWNEPNYRATNETGFSALPAGGRWDEAKFYSMGNICCFWSFNWIRAVELFTYDYDIFFGNAHLIDGFSVRCLRDTAAEYNISDKSDAVFSIVAPEAYTHDIDMKKGLVGSSKDSLITDFIKNTGSYKFRVDSIYFSGAHPEVFSLSSGFAKYELSPTESKTIEIVFSPIKVGVNKAIINIVTQFDTLKQNIMGIGVRPKIEVISKLLDFGQVDIGNEKIFQDTALIKNIYGAPITISNVVQLGPDLKQFDIVSGGGAFTLQPYETRKLSVKFKPIYAGRISGQIGFEYDDVGTPAIVQLFGNGTGGLKITIKNDSAYAGQARRLKLVMSNADPQGIAKTAPNFSATIRFQKTILTPLKKSERNIINDSIYTNIKGSFGKTQELAQIPVMAGLGLVEETSLDIVDFILTDASGNKVDVDLETTSGKFKLLGICEEGGTRLINPIGKVEILQIIPNPASDNLEINLNLIEDGVTTLSVLNSNGIKLKEINITGETGLKSITIDAREFDNGMYFIQLQTPTVVVNKKLMIIK
ncbi:MAG: FISUMP domain-containing protein [bacterium]